MWVRSPADIPALTVQLSRRCHWLGSICIQLPAILTISGSVSFGEQRIIVQKVETAPIINGIADDFAWEKSSTILTHDKVANIDISLKAVYTAKQIFFLVTFPTLRLQRGFFLYSLQVDSPESPLGSIPLQQ